MTQNDKPVSGENSALVFLHNIFHGPLVNSPEMACDIGRLIFSRFYGQEEMKKEEPFRYRDDGESWTVAGSHQPSDMPDGSGIWFVMIKKADARVLSIGRNIKLEALNALSSEGRICDAGES
jgi:hypothetical protein